MNFIVCCISIKLLLEKRLQRKGESHDKGLQLNSRGHERPWRILSKTHWSSCRIKKGFGVQKTMGGEGIIISWVRHDEAPGSELRK